MSVNAIIQSLMSQLQAKSPQGVQVIQKLMNSNGNPEQLIAQLMGNATPEQKQGLLKQAKQYGVPDNILAKIQNMR